MSQTPRHLDKLVLAGGTRLPTSLLLNCGYARVCMRELEYNKDTQQGSIATAFQKIFSENESYGLTVRLFEGRGEE